MPRQPGTRAAIGIVGGSRVVGEALELLLQGLGYRARFVPLPVGARPQPLAGSQLVVLAPGLSPDQRSAVLAAMHEGDGIPVVELTRDAAAGSAHDVHWPCRAEVLAQAIDAVLEPRAIGGRA